MKELLRQAASAALQLVYQDFAMRHLSGNLMRTLELSYTDEWARLRIPAVSYDLGKWGREKVVVYEPWRGSYAEKVNVGGGFSHTHQQYAERAAIGAVRVTMGANEMRYSIEET